MRTLLAILHNPVLIPGLYAWFLAQLLKVVLTLLTKRRLDLQRFVGSGGMPSSHSAVVTSVAVSAGLYAGFGSIEFGLAAAVAMVVMSDAAGVRRAAGHQARLLNEIVENFFADHQVNEKKLIELLGHTPIEVMAGCLLGIAVALLYARWL